MNPKKLLESLDLEFANKHLLEEAMTHRSFLNESKTTLSSNERLEFLGDSILSFLVSSHLFKTFPDIPEGELTNLRSATVKTTTLAMVAQRLNLGAYLRLSHGEEDGGGRQNPSLLADTFEALIGALYLDRGLEVTRSFLKKHLFHLIPEIISTRAYVDFKSDFQERVQEKYRISPSYKVLKEEGPDHAKIFHVAVYINGVEHGVGSGKSKQEAEQEAARSALSNLRMI